MLTPDFRVQQDDDTVTFHIRMPYIRTQEVEIRILENEFLIWARPYYLKLELPGRLVDDDDKIISKYDISSGEMIITTLKENKGENFQDLNLLTNLFFVKNDRQFRTGRDLIQELEVDENLDNNLKYNNDSIDIHFSEDEDDLDKSYGNYTYGFNSQYKDLGPHLEETSYEIIKIQNVDKLTAQDKRKLRIKAEDAKFDTGHYIADFMDYESIKPFIDFRPKSYQVLAAFQSLRKTTPETSIEDMEWLKFTDNENRMLIQLSNRNYLIDNEKVVYLGLLDILLAYCYDIRATKGEPTSESAWTIATLSSLLSSLDSFTSFKDVIVGFMRRSISFPLYRNFELSKKCVKDATVVLKLGKRCVIRYLLEIKNILDNDERTHVLSRIYLSDYCVWTQKCSERNIHKLAHTLNNFHLDKSITGWELNSIEREFVEQ